MLEQDIDRLCVLDLACMKHCGKQLPILTLHSIVNFVNYLEELDRIEEAKRRRTLKRTKKPNCPEGTQDMITVVTKGAHKKKWTPRKENRQCITNFRMRQALRINMNN